MTETGWPPAFAAELRRFPADLQTLLRAELAAGNEIVAAGGGFPAPPIGGMAVLKAPISTPTDGLVARRWPNWSSQSGYTDAGEIFFVLNPPPPPPPEPDQDAIRAGLASAPPNPSAAERSGPARSTRVDRFAESMAIDYEKWHDGIGYDVGLLAEATAEERAEIETLLLPRARDDWRDIEALAALGTDRARAAIADAFRHGRPAIRMAVLDYAADLISEEARTEAVVDALRRTTFGEGLSQALDHAAEFHPPAVIDALLEGAATRPGEVAVHCAAMLWYLHGMAATPFDWDQRPFYLRFAEPPGARREAVAELLAGIGRA